MDAAGNVHVTEEYGGLGDVDTGIVAMSVLTKGNGEMEKYFVERMPAVAGGYGG